MIHSSTPAQVYFYLHLSLQSFGERSPRNHKPSMCEDVTDCSIAITFFYFERKKCIFLNHQMLHVLHVRTNELYYAHYVCKHTHLFTHKLSICIPVQGCLSISNSCTCIITTLVWLHVIYQNQFIQDIHIHVNMFPHLITYS